MSDGPLLVTGATGFVGSHVVEQARAAGHAVVATGRDAERFSGLPFAGGVRFIACDLHRDPAPLCAVANDVSALLHLAWPDLPDYRNPSHVTHHLGADTRFLQQMVGAGLRRIVWVGTCLEYGLREGELSEDMPTDPSLPYPIAKDALRRLITTILDADTVSVETLVRQRIAQMNANTVPKLGVYEYPDYEPMAFWAIVVASRP